MKADTDMDLTGVRSIFYPHVTDIIRQEGVDAFSGQIIELTPDLHVVANVSLSHDGCVVFRFSDGLMYYLLHASIYFARLIQGDQPAKSMGVVGSQTSLENLNSISYRECDPFKLEIEFYDWYNTTSAKEKSLAVHLFEMSVKFVVLHEYGHVISGHLHHRIRIEGVVLSVQKSRDGISTATHNYGKYEKSIAWSLELQADVIATQKVLNHKMMRHLGDVSLAYEKMGDKQWHSCTMSGIMIVCALFELADQHNNCTTHPPARLRLPNILKHVIGAVGYSDRDDLVDWCLAVVSTISLFFQNLNIEPIDIEETLHAALLTSHFKKKDHLSLALTQEKTHDLRRLFAEDACQAIGMLNKDVVFKLVMKSVALSGLHYPWAAKDSWQYALQIIKPDIRVLKLLKTEEGEFAQELAKHLEQNMDISKKSIDEKLVCFISMTEDELFLDAGSELADSGFMNNPLGKDIDDELRVSLAVNVLEQNALVVALKYEKTYLNSLSKEKFAQIDESVKIAAIADCMENITMGLATLQFATIIVKRGACKFMSETILANNMTEFYENDEQH